MFAFLLPPVIYINTLAIWVFIEIFILKVNGNIHVYGG